MISVELIYDADCPNIEEARAQLLRAFSQAGLSPRWMEWERSAIESPLYARAYGSPTILVGGQDIAGALPNTQANCCRIYPDQNGRLSHIPSAEAIASAIVNARNGSHSSPDSTVEQVSRWPVALFPLPAIAAALLPKLGCPACWPAYAGLLSTMGLGFVNYTPYLLPMTLAFVLITLGSMWLQVRRSRRNSAFLLGLAASAAVIAGKFVLESEPLMYSGIGLMVAASLFGNWPRRAASASCSACAPAGSGIHSRAHKGS